MIAGVFLLLVVLQLSCAALHGIVQHGVLHAEQRGICGQPGRQAGAGGQVRVSLALWYRTPEAPQQAAD